MIAPCVGVLRDLAKMMRETLGTDLGSKHAPTNLSVDIPVLMESLAEHEVYAVKGRVFAEGDGTPTPDVIAVGFEELVTGVDSPLVEYNRAFARLQARRRLPPLVGEAFPSTVPPSTFTASDVDVPMDGIQPATDPSPQNDELNPEMGDDEDPNLDPQKATELEQSLEEREEPTLTRDTAEDVALDMDCDPQNTKTLFEEGCGDSDSDSEDDDSENSDVDDPDDETYVDGSHF